MNLGLLPGNRLPSNKKKNVFITLLALVFISSSVSAEQYYVAKKDCSNSYPGTKAKSWCTISYASEQLQPGDTLYILDGDYVEQIRPYRSGSEKQPIRYIGVGSNVRILLPAKKNVVIELSNRQHIVIDSLIVDARSKGMWINAGWGIRGHYTIQNCTFVNPDNYQHGIYLESAPYNKILKNYFSHGAPGSRTGTDAIMLTDNSGYTLLQENIIENAKHAGLKVESSYVIIRNNKISNLYNQAAESGGGRPEHRKIVWEYNTFTNKGEWGIDPEPAQGMQFYTRDSIVRYNIFYDCAGGGLTVEGYQVEASIVTDNRFYNNFFFNNRGEGGVHLVAWEYDVDMTGNIFKNNVFYKNLADPNSNHTQLLITEYCGSDLVKNNYFINNNFWNAQPDETVINHYKLGRHSVSWWENNFPDNFYNNLEVDPAIVDEGNYCFNLNSDSKLIDSGDFLTNTINSGSGNHILVKDSMYFTDGFGIVPGDEIIIGNNRSVRIKKINYEKNLLTIDRNINWNEKDSVSLVYTGSAPDIGPFEFGQTRSNHSTD